MSPEWHQLVEAARKLLETVADSFAQGSASNLGKLLSTEGAKGIRQFLLFLKKFPDDKKEFQRDVEEIYGQMESLTAQIVILRAIADENVKLKSERDRLRFANQKLNEMCQGQSEELARTRSQVEDFRRTNAELLTFMNGSSVHRPFDEDAKPLSNNPFR